MKTTRRRCSTVAVFREHYKTIHISCYENPRGQAKNTEDHNLRNPPGSFWQEWRSGTCWFRRMSRTDISRLVFHPVIELHVFIRITYFCLVAFLFHMFLPTLPQTRMSHTTHTNIYNIYTVIYQQFSRLKVFCLVHLNAKMGFFIFGVIRRAEK